METSKPKLRFPEFNSDWKTKKLSDVSKIGRGKSKHRPRDAEFLYGGEYPFIQTGDIRNADLYLTNYTQTYSEAGLKQSKLWDENTLCITIAANIAETTILKIKACFPDSIIGLIPNVNDTIVLFVKYQFDKFKIEIQNLSQGVAQANLNQEKLSNIKFNFPTLQEQIKIANFLSSIDEKLNLLKEKKELLEDYKKGIMQKIFNQEIRFKDDNGNDFEDWKTSILSDVVNLFHGFQFRTSDFTSKGIAIIKISNVIGNNLDLNNLTFIKKERFEDFKSFEIKNDDILMSLTGNIGRIIEVKDKPFTILQNYRVGKFIPLDENVINKPFLKYLLASDLVFGRFSQLANQSAQANFGKQDMDKINISYPPIAEQNKIANFLSALDEKIELVSNQIQDTQEYKKGLLQQMFV